MAAQKQRLAIVAGIVLVLLVSMGIAVIATGPTRSVGSPRDVVSAETKQVLQFSDGSTVELLGIQADPFDGKWWNADGSEITAPQHTDQPRISMHGDAGTHTVRLMIRPSSTWSRDQQIKVQLVPGVRTGVSGFEAKGGRMFEAVALVGDEVKVADIQIGAAGGLWTNDMTYDVASGQYSSQSADGIRVGNISQQGSETRVEIQYPPNINAWKDTSVLVMAGGQQLQIAHSQESGLGLACYFKCDKKDLTTIISRSRDYEIKTISNVHLSLSAPPASAPGGK